MPGLAHASPFAEINKNIEIRDNLCLRLRIRVISVPFTAKLK